MKYRIEEMDDKFYPQIKYRWLPFWAYFYDCYDCKINYDTIEEADHYLKEFKTDKIPIYHYR